MDQSSKIKSAKLNMIHTKIKTDETEKNENFKNTKQK